MENIQAYKQFFNADFSKLPTEVLHSIRVAIEKEVRSRLDENKCAARTERDLVNKYAKRVKSSFHASHLRYLDHLLSQDWTGLFGGETDRKYYVYIHAYPKGKSVRFHHEKCVIDTAGLPFYVGKGTGNRAYDMNRNEGHGVILRQLKGKGHTSGEIVSIVKDGMTEAEAYALESQLIHFFGTKFDKSQGILVNLETPKVPQDA